MVSSFVLWSKSWLESQSLASTTPEAERFEEGAEPDKCYYIKRSVVGRTVNLDQDPPPDLVVEVDITPTLTRMLCMQNGDTGVMALRWQALRIYQLQMGKYQGSKQPNIPWVQEVFYRFLEQCKTQGEAQANRKFRIWVQEIKHNPSLPQTPSPYSFK